MSFIRGLESAASALGVDKHIHKATGGQRVMERDGRVSKDVVQGLEKAFSESGLDNVVHFGTGGARVVNSDGSFNPEGALDAAVALGQLADPSGAAAATRALAMAYEKSINEAIKAIERANSNAGSAAKKIKQLRDLVNLVKGVASNPIVGAKDLPKLVKQFLEIQNS